MLERTTAAAAVVTQSHEHSGTDFRAKGQPKTIAVWSIRGERPRILGREEEIKGEQAGTVPRKEETHCDSNQLSRRRSTIMYTVRRKYLECFPLGGGPLVEHGPARRSTYVLGGEFLVVAQN